MKAYMKFISTVLALTMIASSLAGCGNEPAESEKDSALNIANNIEIVAGDKTTIEINKNKDEEAVFSSDNEDVAKIDENGEITAVSNGEAVITVKIGDKEEFYAVKVTDKSPEDIAKELEETKKQLEEALKENAELKGETSESSSEAPAEDENSKKSSDKAENAESKPAESKPTSNNSSVPSWQVDLSTYVPAPNAITEGLPEYLWDYLEMNNNKDTTKWKEEGIVPQNFDIYFARQEYNAGIGPYRGGTTTGAPADWGDSGKPDNPEYDAPIPSDETFKSGSREEAEEIIRLANEYRTKAGLSAVSIDEHLMDVASTRAKETSEKFDHERPNGEMDQYCAAPTYSWVMCNLHYGASDSSGAVKAWMRSTEHKRNMMYPEHDIVGAASYKKGSITYWVIIFATYDGQYPNY